MPIKKSWDVLSRVYNHGRDSRIVFEEEDHKYRINGDTKGWKSVTQVLSKFHEPFDPDKCAMSVMNSRAYKNNTHSLSGKTKEEIIEHWNGENKKGTALHARMERGMNQKFHLNFRTKRHSSGELILERRRVIFRKNDDPGTEKRLVLVSNRNREAYTYDLKEEFGDLSGMFLGYVWRDLTVRRNMEADSELGKDEPILSYKEAILETEQVNAFWENHSHLEPYRSEWVVWDSDWKIAGTIDGVFLDKRDKSYWILDWKRVRSGLEADLEATRWGYIQQDDEYLEPVKPWAKKMPSPLDDFYSTKYWNYSLQLNLYREILEKNYGIHIKGMKLVQFHPELGSECRTHNVMRLEEPIRRVLCETNGEEDRCESQS
jgi:hypothetical protein